MAFRIEWKKSTRKDLRKLPANAADKIVEAVEQLSQNPFPHGVEKLSGSEHAYRIRLGDSGLFMKSSQNRSWLKSSACGIARMFIGFELRGRCGKNLK